MSVDYYDVTYGVKVLGLNSIVSYCVTSFQLITNASIIWGNNVSIYKKGAQLFCFESLEVIDWSNLTKVAEGQTQLYPIHSFTKCWPGSHIRTCKNQGKFTYNWAVPPIYTLGIFLRCQFV